MPVTINRKEHWEKVYRTKGPHEVSWTQGIPKTSLEFIHQCNLAKSAYILDIGSGDSTLVDHLLDEGYYNIYLLDISKEALGKTRIRLGDKAEKVRWLICDILDFKSNLKFDLWHDRATFHFFTKADEIRRYINTARQLTKGYLTIATFSDKGPEKCSGLEIKRYSERLLQKELSDGFEKIRCITEDHITPFNTAQNFLFCSFKRASV